MTEQMPVSDAWLQSRGARSLTPAASASIPSSTPAPRNFRTRDDLDYLLREAYRRGASDVYLGGDEPPTARVYGRFERLHNRDLEPREVWSLLVASYDDNVTAETRVKSGVELDYSYACQPQAGEALVRWRVHAEARSNNGRNDVRVVFRSINADPPHVDELEVEPEIVELVSKLRQGLVIVTGPTGSGKSTLLASLLRYRIEDPDDHVHIVTVEAPIEYVYPRRIWKNCVVTQREVLRHTESFQQAVRSAMRADPDLVLIGECRDYETMAAALEVCQTGHGALTTMHTNGVASTMRRMLARFPQEERILAQMDLIDNTHLIVSTMLVADTRGKRTALREYLVFDGAVKDKLRGAPDLFAATMRVMKTHGHGLLNDAAKKFSAGRIGQETFARIKHTVELQERAAQQGKFDDQFG